MVTLGNWLSGDSKSWLKITKLVKQKKNFWRKQEKTWLNKLLFLKLVTLPGIVIFVPLSAVRMFAVGCVMAAVGGTTVVGNGV